ncbi:MAG: hypothetical protein GY950_37510 [bacterium]|nr:hypothetical protein [bacterium]
MMNKYPNHAILKGILITALALLISLNGFAFVQLNGSGGSYCDPVADPGCDGNNSNSDAALASAASSGGIEPLIVEGAAAYINAYSAYLAFLNRVETHGPDNLDYEKTGVILDEALKNIIAAKSAYYRLIIAAEAAQYNPAVLEKLAAFDYDGYFKKHRLMKDIFGEVKAYLKGGDVTGTYLLTFSTVKEVEDMLVSIKSAVESGGKPELLELWKVNGMLSETFLFGEYVARVFFEMA